VNDNKYIVLSKHICVKLL